MITGIRHTGLVVADLNKAIHFWRDLLGFKIVTQMDEMGPHLDSMMGLKDTRVTTVKMVAPCNGMIELLHFQSHPDAHEWNGTPHSTGFTHIAMTVKNIDEACKRLLKARVTFFAKPQYSPNGTVRAIYCKGPEGVLLELVEELML